MTDENQVSASIAKARAEVELEFAKVQLFWQKWGHPALYALVAIVSAVVGHQL